MKWHVLLCAIVVLCAGVLVGGCAVPGAGGAEPTLTVSQESQVVDGVDTWYGPVDCSAKAWLSRGADGITVTVEVTDDQLWTDSDVTYECDSVELYFDVRPANTRGTGYYDRGVFQLIIVPGCGEQDDRMAFYHGEGDAAWAVVAGVTTTSRRMDSKGYCVEAFLPFEGFKENHFVPEVQFNFDLGVNDGDAGPRESQIIWHGTGENWSDPSDFGSVDLGG